MLFELFVISNFQFILFMENYTYGSGMISLHQMVAFLCIYNTHASHNSIHKHSHMYQCVLSTQLYSSLPHPVHPVQYCSLFMLSIIYCYLPIDVCIYAMVGKNFFILYLFLQDGFINILYAREILPQSNNTKCIYSVRDINSSYLFVFKIELLL